ncbi:SRPBCC family protein [Yinghuangia seranimata]|uniref:SRPBCC family protein n=1 Tax=Yinghuangia seranimata TaxID=408067 RepID=UPI00248BA18D|nr:SRPBCC family protein [Yinghuangia seranimata]MDI2125961.1 SRPBCC family protein [Yinghuangia seranimata]
MRLTNTVAVDAPPDAVFALVNDVERVASCMPGARLEGRDGDAWRGGVKVKVGPITAAYAGTVRFLEVDPENRTLRVHARGADTHGSGDAEAEVVLVVAETPGGARLDLTTDLVIRGKIAQFGKGAIGAVSDRILRQFAANLGGLLHPERAPDAAPVPGTASGAHAPAAGGATATSAAPAAEALDGLALLGGPALAKYAPVAAAFAFGVFEGWLLGRLTSMKRELRAIRRGA